MDIIAFLVLAAVVILSSAMLTISAVPFFGEYSVFVGPAAAVISLTFVFFDQVRHGPR